MEAQYGFTKEILVMEAPESPLSDSVSSEHKSDSQWVKLLMEDYCDSPKLFKISQQVHLYVIDTLHCGPGEWRVDRHDLLAELQSRAMIWDPDHPKNRVYFVEVTDDALLDEVQPAPQFAMIPGTDILEIFVGHVGWKTHIFTFAQLAMQPGSSRARQMVMSRYAELLEQRRKVQQNTGVVVSWNFVAVVSETYFGQAYCG
ncbi:hypothetical protein DFH09DRAFT_1106978 [Mycena vulgaris]|nr:hypothetical protein DFH09DRAFT_1106978 [Mycena vulgaris]